MESRNVLNFMTYLVCGNTMNSNSGTCLRPTRHVFHVPPIAQVRKRVKQSHYRPGRPWGFHEVQTPRYQDNWHINVVRLSALGTGCLYRQEVFLVLISVKRLSRPQGHSATGRIMSMKNSNDTSASSERNFSVAGLVLQVGRNNLTQWMCHSDLFLRNSV
jgi:hypothetical protein